MGHLEGAGKKIFDVLNTGKHVYGFFAPWGMRLGAGKLGAVPILGLLACFALESSNFYRYSCAVCCGRTESTFHQIRNRLYSKS